MYINGYEIIAPNIFGQSIEESQIFGALATIWLRSNHHRNAPLYRFAERAIPIIHSRQFALFIKDKQPMAYISWAYFDKECEESYLTSDDVLNIEKNWHSGERGWFIDWFSPDSSTVEINSILRKYLFPNSIFSYLYRKSPKNNPKRCFFRGYNVNRTEFRLFISSVTSERIDY